MLGKRIGLILGLEAASKQNHINDLTLQSWKKLSGQLRKAMLSLTPQAMYNQFKRSSTGSVR